MRVLGLVFGYLLFGAGFTVGAIALVSFVFWFATLPLLFVILFCCGVAYTGMGIILALE